ncbi:hypothetical protein TrLO_g10709 [Triparma laevis f. longispina]|uniref:Uncharacterized protein n=1 Tax=Triparma laevis f. longispina TaxID=1714387 RepID=A0A9W7CD84_9STRA|nr:hypothetical protein TrLO_g10709 [Triparma laevis f. longispina]
MSNYIALESHTLMRLRLATKGWKAAADALIDEEVESGAMIVRGSRDMASGDWACCCTVNLVVVDIPEGMESIGWCAFCGCSSMTTVSFPTTLTSIDSRAFADCSSLDNVDLLHTNLQKIDWRAFKDCSELKSMMIPDSLQTLGEDVFLACSKLVPSSIDVNEVNGNNASSEVVAHLRSQQNNP